MTADDGTDLAATFEGLIRNASLSKQGFAYNQSSLVIRVSGGIDFDVIIDPPSGDFDILSDYWQGPNSQNYISGATPSEVYTYTLEATDTPILVDLEGTQFDLVSSTPAAGKRECKFSTSPVRITFPSDIIFDGTQRIYVMFKRPV